MRRKEKEETVKKAASLGGVACQVEPPFLCEDEFSYGTSDDVDRMHLLVPGDALHARARGFPQFTGL